MILLKINVYEEKEEKVKLFSIIDLLSRNIEEKLISNTIVLYYNIEENSIYYKDNNKDIKTKKDFCRSLEIIEEIIQRLNAFDVEWEIKEDNIDDFIKNLIDGKENFPINNILVGSQGYDLTLLSRKNSDIVKYIIPNIDDGTYKEMLGRI